MGKILVKAQEQNVYNLGKSGQKSSAYVLRPVRYSTMRSDDIVNNCVTNSSIPRAYVGAAMQALAQTIETFLLNGHSVEFPNLGIFYLTSNGFSVQQATETGVGQCEKLNVRFRPCTSLKDKVDLVELEFDGAYQIAGQTVVKTDSTGTATKTQKYYKKVYEGSTESADTTSGPFTITLSASPANGGTVSGAGSYENNAEATIKATASTGYHFNQWSDGNTSATRTLTVTADKSLTAIFVPNSEDGE